MEKFTFVGFLLRLAAAIVLVLATFNPSGHSFYHWIADGFPHITPMEAVVGIVLLCAIVLAIGMSWSHVRRRLTGQADVDEVDGH